MKFSCCLFMTIVVFAGSANAVELRPIEVKTGTEGLINAPLSVANKGAEPMACHADLAHWYSTQLATVSPGTQSLADLWFDPQDGTFSLLNDKQEQMAVESLWCGIDGRAYETRAALLLDRSAVPTPRLVECAADNGKMVCR